MANNNQINEDWIKITGSTFVCNECENDGEPLTMTPDGMVKADLEAIKSELEQYSTKIIYAVCPVCGMEYVFRLVDGELYLEPSEEEK